MIHQTGPSPLSLWGLPLCHGSSSTASDSFEKRTKTSFNVGQPFSSFPEATGLSPNLLKSRASDGTVSILRPSWATLGRLYAPRQALRNPYSLSPLRP